MLLSFRFVWDIYGEGRYPLFTGLGLGRIPRSSLKKKVLLRHSLLIKVAVGRCHRRSMLIKPGIDNSTYYYHFERRILRPKIFCTCRTKLIASLPGYGMHVGDIDGFMGALYGWPDYQNNLQQGDCLAVTQRSPNYWRVWHRVQWSNDV